MSEKKKPGRPSKRVEPPSVGIASEPSSARNCLEMVQNMPAAISSLFSYLRNIRAKHLIIRADATGISIFARNQGNTMKIHARIHGNKSAYYYCERELLFGLSRAAADPPFSATDRTMNKLSILHLHDNPEKLVILVEDEELSKQCVYKICISLPEHDEELTEMEPNINDPIILSWTITAKQFKKSMADISGLTDVVTIQKNGDRPLQLVHNKCMASSYAEIYNDNNKIDLQCSLGHNQVYCCELGVAPLKSVSTAMLSDTVLIECRQGHITIVNDSGGIVVRSQIHGSF